MTAPEAPLVVLGRHRPGPAGVAEPSRPTPGRRSPTSAWPSATKCSPPSSPPWPGDSSELSRTTRTTSSTASGPAEDGDPTSCLPTDDHERRYVAAAIEHLKDAARSGATFAGGKPDDAPPVDAVAGDLAAAIVVPLRRRLDGAGGSVEAGDDTALVEHVGAAFREWKGARVERLAGDEALAAFSAGLPGRRARRGTSLRWIVDDGGVQCPDCDDNALAGPLRRGETFPTGHRSPPAHAGCRCLLAPAEA